MSSASGIVRIIQQGASVAGTRLVLIVASFASSVVVARALPIEERGRFGLLIAVGALAIQFGNFGLPVANTYLIARQPSLLTPLVANTTRSFLVVTAFIGVVGAAALRLVPAWTPLWGPAGIMVWFVAVTGLIQMIAQNLLIGRFQFSTSNLVDIVARMGAIVGMMLLWAWGAVTASWFAFVASLFAALAAFWGLHRGKITMAIRNPDLALWRLQLRLGSRAYVACLASFVVSRLPLYLVGSHGGMAETAYFTQALVIADTMLVVPNALGTVLFPNMAAARDARERIRATLRVAAITAGLMAIGVVAAMILGPIVLPFVYGRAYSASMPVLLAMLTGVAALGVCSVMQNALSANGYPWASVASPVAGVAAVAVGLSVSSTAIGCGWAYSLGGVVMLLTSSIAWWLHRNDWAEIQAVTSEAAPTQNP